LSAYARSHQVYEIHDDGSVVSNIAAESILAACGGDA